MTQEQFLSLVRSLLKFGGGYIVAHGMIDDATLQTIIGALAAIAGLVWSHFEHSDPAK